LEFGKMLQVLAGGLPFESVQPALRLLVKNLLAADVREYAFKAEIFTRDGESAKTNNAIDAAILFFGMLINRDPELAQQLETTRPELRTALEYAKDGRQAKMEFREMQFAGRRRLQNLAPPDPDEDVRLDALRLANINAEAAIAKAEQLPDDKRASTMLWVARNIAGNHPERAAELVAEIQRGNKTNDDETQLDLISAQVFVAAGQHKKDDLNRLLQRGFDAANRLVVQPQVTNGNRPVPGLGPMVQIGIQNNPELTISFIEGLPASYLKADLLLGAASALHMHMSLPLSSQPHQRAEKPDQ
jgi:hypothetical protein